MAATSSPEPASNLLAEITRCADRLGRIADLTKSLFSACEVEAVVREVTATVRSIRPDAVCVVRLVDPDAGGYRLALVEGASPEGLLPVIPFGRGLVHEVAETRAPIFRDDLSRDRRALHREWHRAHGTGGFYAVPIEAGGKLLGVLSMVAPAGSAITAEERELFDLFGEQAGLAIQASQPLFESAGPRAAVADLAELGRAMAAAPDVSAVAGRLADSVLALLGVQAAALYLLGRDGELEPLGSSGSARAPRGGRVVLAASRAVAALAVRERRSVTVDDLLADPRIALGGEVVARLRGASCRTALGVPLTVGERALGALVALDRAGSEFAGEGVRLTQAVADLAALTIDHRRLVDHADARDRSARVTSDVLQAMAAASDPAAALAAVAGGARVLLDADVAAIALWDADAAALRLACRVTARPGLAALPIERGIVAGSEIALPQWSAWSAEWGTAAPRTLRFDAAGAMIVAVRVPAGDRPRGVLYAARRAPRTGELDEAGLSGLADLAAIAARQADLSALEARARADREVAEERVRDLLESLNTIVWEAGAPGPAHPRPFSSITRRVEGMLGYPVDAWLTQPGFWARVLHPEDRDAVVAACLAAVAEGRDWELDYRVLAADGRTVWLHETGRVTRGSDGAVTGLHGILVDITGRKGVEEERALLISAMEQASDAIMITTADGAIAYVNPAFRRLTGYSLSEAVGHTPHLLRSGRERPTFYDDLWATLRAGEVWRGETINRRKDGTLFTAQQSIAPLREERGRITHFVSIAQDITRRKELESQLLQSQKMEAVGQLAGGVAHDFNNLLTVILGRGDFLLARLGADDPLRREVDLILKTAERAGTLTHQLLAFSRKQVLQPTVLDLNALVAGMGSMLQRLIGEDIDLRIVADRELGPVKADPAQLEQVVMNLVVNARDAMPQGGRLTLETANVSVDESAPAGVAARVPAGAYATLAVRDTGVGMFPDVQARIFEPFYTTKERGRGTGLGLSTVYGIVQQHRGHIVVESEPGRGTIFTLYLPRVGEPAPAVTAPPRAAEAKGGTATILLVEDDAALRIVVREMLSAHGYAVLEARDGEQALALIAAHGERIGLLLTDVVMPKTGGVEVAATLRRQRPDARVLYMSGYPERGGSAGDVTPLLPKPFSPQDLLRRVREVLGVPGAR